MNLKDIYYSLDTEHNQYQYYYNENLNDEMNELVRLFFEYEKGAIIIDYVKIDGKSQIRGSSKRVTNFEEFKHVLGTLEIIHNIWDGITMMFHPYPSPALTFSKVANILTCTYHDLA